MVYCETDHKPLVPLGLLSIKNLDELPPCIQQFCMHLMRFCFVIFHVPGKDLVIADALSIAPLAQPSVTDEGFQTEVEAYLNTVVQTLLTTEKEVANIPHHQKSDEVCQQLISYCSSTWLRSLALSRHITQLLQN